MHYNYLIQPKDLEKHIKERIEFFQQKEENTVIVTELENILKMCQSLVVINGNVNITVGPNNEVIFSVEEDKLCQ